MMPEKVHICVIDDGICESEICVFEEIEIKNGKVAYSSGQYSNFSHGTACAKVIEKYVDKEILISTSHKI